MPSVPIRKGDKSGITGNSTKNLTMADDRGPLGAIITVDAVTLFIITLSAHL